MRVVALAALLVCSALQSGHGSEAKVLAERIRDIAKRDVWVDRWTPAFVHFPHKFFTKEQLEVAKSLRACGSEAIPHLLPLLRDENPAIQDLAYFTLSDIEGWTEEHLDGLIAAYFGGDDWIPSAIAKIGTPKAADFLVGELVRRPTIMGQLERAVVTLGKGAVPHLLRVYQVELNWDAELEAALYHAFHGLNDRAADAIEPLMKLAADGAEPGPERFRAVKALGAIGPTALLAFRDNRNCFLSAVPAAEHPGDPYTTKRLLESIAALRERGAFAGPLVLRLLTSSDWEVRVEAVRALGRIGYHEATDELIELLRRSDDWRLVFTAAESLGMLKSEAASSALAVLEERHWYPAVREVAHQSLRAIRTGIAIKPNERVGVFDFFDGPVGDSNGSLLAEEADKVRFKVQPPPPRLDIVIKAEDGAARSEKRTAIEVEDGYLVGTDDGEFGGDVAFVDRDGNSRVLAPENTQAIYQTRHGIFSVSGLGHMGYDSGFIFKLQKTDDRWAAEKWRALPGAPRFSRLLKDGSLFVSCDGGMVMVSPDGKMKFVSRSEATSAAD